MVTRNLETFSDTLTPREWIVSKTTSRLRDLKDSVSQSVINLKRNVSSRVNMIIAAATLATVSPVMTNASEPSAEVSKAPAITALASLDTSKTLDTVNYTIAITKGTNTFTVTQPLPVPNNAAQKIIYTSTPNANPKKAPTLAYPTTLTPWAQYYTISKVDGVLNISLQVPNLIRIDSSAPAPVPSKVTPQVSRELSPQPLATIDNGFVTQWNAIFADKASLVLAEATTQADNARLTDAQAAEAQLDLQYHTILNQYTNAVAALASIDIVTYNKGAAYLGSVNAILTSSSLSAPDKLTAITALNIDTATLPANADLTDRSSSIQPLIAEIQAINDANYARIEQAQRDTDNATIDRVVKDEVNIALDSLAQVTTLSPAALFDTFGTPEERAQYASVVPKINAYEQAEANLVVAQTNCDAAYHNLVGSGDQQDDYQYAWNNYGFGEGNLYNIAAIRQLRTASLANITTCIPLVQQVFTDNNVVFGDGTPIILPSISNGFDLYTWDVFVEFYNEINAAFPAIANVIAWRNLSTLCSNYRIQNKYILEFPDGTLESNPRYQQTIATFAALDIAQASLSTATTNAHAAQVDLYSQFNGSDAGSTNNPEALAFIAKYHLSSVLSREVAGHGVNDKIAELRTKLQNGTLTTADLPALKSLVDQNTASINAHLTDPANGQQDVQSFIQWVGNTLTSKSAQISTTETFLEQSGDNHTLTGFFNNSLPLIDLSGHPDLAAEAADIRRLASNVAPIVFFVNDYNQKRQNALNIAGYTLPDVGTITNVDVGEQINYDYGTYLVSRYPLEQLVHERQLTPFWESLIPKAFSYYDYIPNTFSRYYQYLSAIAPHFDQLNRFEQYTKDRICNFYLELIRANVLNPSMKSGIEAQLDLATQTPVTQPVVDTISAQYTNARTTVAGVDTNAYNALQSTIASTKPQLDSAADRLSAAHARTLGIQSIVSADIQSANTIRDRVSANVNYLLSKGVTIQHITSRDGKSNLVATVFYSDSANIAGVEDVVITIPWLSTRYYLNLKAKDLEYFKNSDIPLRIATFANYVSQFETLKKSKASADVKDVATYGAKYQKIIDAYISAVQLVIKNNGDTSSLFPISYQDSKNITATLADVVIPTPWLSAAYSLKFKVKDLEFYDNSNISSLMTTFAGYVNDFAKLKLSKATADKNDIKTYGTKYQQYINGYVSSVQSVINSHGDTSVVRPVSFQDFKSRQ